MGVHKLTDWDIEEEPFILIALHSTVEPYRMAYLINKFAELGFKRAAVDQDIKQATFTAQYPVYKHFDENQNVGYYMVPNKHWGVSSKESISSGLFDTKEAALVKTMLVKEYATVDFLIKIESDEYNFPLKKLLHTLGEIPQVISVYPLDTYKIKQKDYLIFE